MVNYISVADHFASQSDLLEEISQLKRIVGAIASSNGGEISFGERDYRACSQRDMAFVVVEDKANRRVLIRAIPPGATS